MSKRENPVVSPGGMGETHNQIVPQSKQDNEGGACVSELEPIAVPGNEFVSASVAVSASADDHAQARSAAAPRAKITSLFCRDMNGRIITPSPQSDAKNYQDGFNVPKILSSVCETVYHWDLRSDKMTWADNAQHVLQLAHKDELASGSDFASKIDRTYSARRFQAIIGNVQQNQTQGPYRICYRFSPSARDAKDGIWIEEQGHWFLGADKRPSHAEGILRIIDDRYEEQQRLVFLSEHDELTGQMNRTRLTRELSDKLKALNPETDKSAFLIGAIDNLGFINETFGFDIGDEVIAITGQRLRSKMRGADAIGRFSANKFGILLNECKPDDVDVATQRLISVIRDEVYQTSKGSVSVSMSFGGVLVPLHGHKVHNLIGNSLEALDQAKTQHTSNFVIYEPSHKRASIRKKNLEQANELVSGLNEKRLILALQPIVCADTRQPEMYECLVRMRRKDGTIASAGDIIPVAERLGLCHLVDMRVLELAIELLKTLPELKLSINISGLTAADKNWINHLEALSVGHQHLLERLTVEITETVAIHDIEATVRFVDMLKQLKCRVAIDDFGAGYSSFRNLKLLGVDMVKIDGAFIRNFADSADDRVFVKTLCDLASNFNLETVAEWVGDEETSLMLQAAGITHLQGFYYGKPEFVETLMESNDDHFVTEQGEAEQKNKAESEKEHASHTPADWLSETA